MGPRGAGGLSKKQGGAARGQRAGNVDDALVAAAAEAVQNPRLQKLFSCVGSAAGMLMGLLGCNAMMLFLSFTAAMKAVSA